jgi:hypothetical protein
MATSRSGLGYPAVSTPRVPQELTAVAAAINAARQRLEAIESALTALQATATGSTSTQAQQLAALVAAIARLTLQVTALNNAAAIDTTTFIAGEALAVFTAVAPSDIGRVVAANASDPLRMFGLIGVTITTAALGQSVTVQRRGPLTIVGANFIDQRGVYVASNGSLTQTPDYEATALPVGVAIDATTLFIAPEWPALVDMPIRSAVDDAFLKFLPVTYAMIADLRILLDVLSTQNPGPAIWDGADLGTDPTVLSALPSGGLNGTEIVLVERDGQWVHTTAREFALYVISLLSVSG